MTAVRAISPQRRRLRRGLSLIELLIALSLGALVLLVTAATFRMALQVRVRAGEIAKELAEERTAQQLIRNDLRSAVLLPEEAGLPFAVVPATLAAGSGAGDMIQFVSLTTDPLVEARPTDGVTVIQYQLAEDPDTGEMVVWRLSLPPPLPEPLSVTTTTTTTGDGVVQVDLAQVPGVRRMALLRGVQSMTMLCYDPTLQDWTAEWLDPLRLPPAVRIDMAVITDPEAASAGQRGREQTGVRYLQWIVQLPAGYYQRPDANTPAEGETPPE